jgi:putative Mg2+ transporter-C (MgtC) family protein
MREEGNVRGLNTAATLWCSGAVGACAGADLIFEAVLGTVFVLLANTALRPLGNLINRQPIDSPDVEVTCTVCVIASLIRQKEAMRELDRILDAHGLPVQELEVEAFGDDAAKIEAKLASTSVDGEQMDALVARLGALQCIDQAYWSPSTTE